MRGEEKRRRGKGGKIYLRSPDEIGDRIKGNDGRLTVGTNNKTGKKQYSALVSRLCTQANFHLLEVMEGRFGSAPPDKRGGLK